jgi:hypothetical protein
MPNPNTNSPTGSTQSPLADTQTLISLLSSLMPLLHRMQAQVAGPFASPDQFAFGQVPFGQIPPGQAPFGQAPFGQAPFGQVPSGHAPFGHATAAPPSALLDHQAAVCFVEDITADSLRNLSKYLDEHAEKHAELATCVEIVTQAARSFAMRDYSQALGLIWQGYRVIAAARSNNPQLPPLRPTPQTGTGSPTPLN